ncbi:MAG TPA: cytochrome b/b6 domain-containing protein [Polyangia bacterium]
MAELNNPVTAKAAPTAADEPAAASAALQGRWVVRFQRRERLLHITLMASFLTLALTGIPLLFPEAPWASKLANLLGGYGVTGKLHRMAAVTLVACFLIHVGRLIERVFLKREYGLLWGPDSMVPQPRDILQMMQHFRWFAGLGPRPNFDRFTYWEKFDYWAVFWGMAIIGLTGLMLWIPATFARLLPGWVFNIALIVHGEEALMAMVFIFTVHFFNGHLRPDKFPMDTVIFTGRVPLEELKHERPGEYDRLVAEGRLVLVDAPSPTVRAAGHLIGSVAVTLGLTIAGLAIWALLR